MTVIGTLLLLIEFKKEAPLGASRYSLVTEEWHLVVVSRKSGGIWVRVLFRLISVDPCPKEHRF
jgi:hypothetical protein